MLSIFRSDMSTVAAAVSGEADCTCDMKTAAGEVVGVEHSAGSAAGAHVSESLFECEWIHISPEQLQPKV